MTVQVFHPTPVDQSATNWAVAARIVGAFAPHAQPTPDMTVALDAGALLNGTTLTEKMVQSTTTIVAPTTNPRIDRVVVDRVSGDVSVVTGIEASSPVAPAIPAGKLPVARVALSTTTTTITDSLITDERALFDLSPDSSLVICRATLGGTNQTGVPSNTDTKLNLSTASINIGNGFDATNKRFKPSVAGYYRVYAQIRSPLSNVSSISAQIHKNGVLTAYAVIGAAVTQTITAVVEDIVYLDGTSDYIEAWGNQNTGASGTFLGNEAWTFFTAQRIG